MSGIVDGPSPSGPIAASGVLTDERGRGTAGRVAVLAWPSEAYHRVEREGDAFATPTIGWAATDTHGRFSVPIDPALIPDGYRAANGQLNLQFVGWNETHQADWVTSTTDPEDASVSPLMVAAADGGSGAPLVADELTLSLGTPKQASRIADGTGISPNVFPNPDAAGCAWYLRDSYRIDENAAMTYPYYAVATVKIGTNRTVTQGFAMNTKAAWGNFTAAGTMSTTAGVTWKPDYVSYGRYWNIEMWYGRYEELCSVGYDPYTLRWAVAPRYPTGGMSSSSPGTRPNYPSANCAAVSPSGTWSRTRSDGYVTTFSAGVDTSGLIGFDMKFTANYGTTTNAERIVYYKFTRSSIVLCGNNDTPATAGIIVEKP